MINFKKMDDKDFVNKPLSNKEDKEFSDFLKLHKKKSKQVGSAKKKKVLSAGTS
jgi:hypothetical protein